MPYLWRLIWLLVDGLYVLQDALFPIGFIIAAIGSGFCLGYLYRFLFAEPGNKELLIMREERPTPCIRAEHS